MKPALEALLKKERNLWRGRDQYHTQDTLPTGHAALDAALPAGGWSLGSLCELLPERQGIGEFSLLLPTLKQITTDQQWVALLNPPYLPYAPALANAGLELERVLVVDTGNDADTLWSAEQLLRSATFQAVILWLNKVEAGQLRRLQLAAEAGNAMAVAYRDASAAAKHSPAALRIQLAPAKVSATVSATTGTPVSQNSGLELQILKARGGALQTLLIEGSEFDALQGIEWPGYKPETGSLHDITTATANAPMAAPPD